ncbi:unnamed protein product [Symbiodinium sp. CCMP2592]|nr:unnamed protein product [Symbiodinium sp. CCMP2592]
MIWGSRFVGLLIFCSFGTAYQGTRESPAAPETADTSQVRFEGLAEWHPTVQQESYTQLVQSTGPSPQCQPATYSSKASPLERNNGQSWWTKRLVVRALQSPEQARSQLLSRVWQRLESLADALHGSWQGVAVARLVDNGKGKGKPPGPKGGKGKTEPPPTAPSIEGLPAAPSAPALAAPKKPAAEATPAPEKTQLEALLGLLVNSAVPLPDGVQQMVQDMQQSSSQASAKVLHRAVTDQSKARQALARIRLQRSTYMEAWRDYLVQLSALLEQQLQEQTTILQSFDEHETQWIGMESQATVQLSKLTSGDKEAPDSIEGTERDAEMAEQQVDNAIETEQRLRAASGEGQEATKKMIAALSEMRQNAEEQIRAHTREGSRTPRRTPLMDLTGEDKSEENAEDKKDGPKQASKFQLGLPGGVEPHSIIQDRTYVGPHACRLLAIMLRFETALACSGVCGHSIWEDGRISGSRWPVPVDLDRAVATAKWELLLRVPIWENDAEKDLGCGLMPQSWHWLRQGLRSLETIPQNAMRTLVSSDLYRPRGHGRALFVQLSTLPLSRDHAPVAAANLDALSQHVPHELSTATSPSFVTVANFCPRAVSLPRDSPRLCNISATGDQCLASRSCLLRQKKYTTARVHFASQELPSCNTPTGSGPTEPSTIVPPGEITPPSAKASAASARSPGQIALFRAEAIQVYPAEVRAAPIFSSPAHLFSWGSGARSGRFTVFDHVRHVTTERCLPAASLADMIALSLSGLPFTASGVVILAHTLPGLPLPQLVFIEQGRTPTELPIPWDLRGIGERIVTLRHSSGDQRDLALQAVQPHVQQPIDLNNELERGSLHLQDALGPVQQTLQVNLHAIQHFRLSRTAELAVAVWDFSGLVDDRPGPDSAAPVTTTTTTAVRVTPMLVQYPSCRLVLMRGNIGYSCVLTNQQHLVDAAMWRLIQQHGSDAPISDEAQIVLAAAQPARQGPYQDVVCLLLEDPDDVTVLWDGRVHQSVVQTSTYSAFQQTQLVLTPQWQEAGWRLAVNGVPDAHMPRTLRNGDLITPFRCNQVPPVVPLGWPLAHFPLLRPYALPISITASDRTFIRGLRLRRLQMGLHLIQEGSVTVYGPAHAELHLYTGLHSVPTWEQALAAVRRVQGVPGLLDFTITPLTAPNAVVLVSSTPNCAQHTILVPAPGYPCQFLPLMVSAHTRHLRGVPADAGVVLVPQRGLARGDVLVARASNAAFFADSDSSMDEDTSALLQVSAANIPARISGKLAVSAGEPRHSLRPNRESQAEGDAVRTTTHNCPVVTPFGRRSLPAQKAVTEAGRTSVRLSECLPLQPSTDVDGPPQRQVSLQCGVTPDMFDFIFRDFGLELFDLDWKDVPALPSCSRGFVALLPRIDRAKPIEAIQLYVDGSYYPDTGQGARAGWAISALGLQRGVWGWIGLCATSTPARGSSRTLQTSVGSSYEVELAALCYALAVACALPAPTMVGYDSTSAGDIAKGVVTAEVQTGLTSAVASLVHLLDVLGRQPNFLHIKSHQQHPLNELVDCAAKAAANGHICSHVPDTLAAAEREGVLSWLWAAIGALASVPALTPAGLLLDCNPPATEPALSELVVDTPCSGRTVLHFQVASYNCLSLASQAQKESLCDQFRRAGASIIGLQETRVTGEARQHSADFHIIASDADQGQHGCLIWFSKKAILGWLDDTPLHWDGAGFSVVLRRPRLLLVLAKVGTYRIAVLCAHAPTSRATIGVRRAWWEELHRAFGMIPCNCVPLVTIDANARLATPPQSDEDNAALLRRFLARHDLAHSACQGDDGSEIGSWISPLGNATCIDYVLYPRSLHGGVKSLGVFSGFVGLVEHDHKPVRIELSVRQEVTVAQSRPRLDLQCLRTPRGQRALQEMLRAMPLVPWNTGVDMHLDAINRHIMQGLEKICPKAQAFARKRITSARTWDLIRRRRELRRQSHQQCLHMRHALLVDCFRSWRRGARTVSVDTHLQGLHLGFLGLQIKRISRRITQSAKQDSAEASRQIFQDARQAGPEKLHKLFKGVLKTGRGYKKPNLTPALLQADGVLAPEPLDVLGAHFATAERATRVDAADLRTPSARTECLTLQATKTFSIPNIIHAFGGMAARKAPGISGVPPEIFRFAPSQAASLHMPLVLKMLLRGQTPTLWRGGRAAAIEKPGKCLTDPAGWRSIMLMEAGAKGLGAAMRAELLSGFDKIRVEGQGGSRPKAPMQAAMSQIRGFVTDLNRRHRSGGVIFVDGQTAFYATVRQRLLGRDASQPLAYLEHLATVLFDDSDDRDRFIATALAPGLLEHCQISPEVRRMVASLLDSTWFSLTAGGDRPYLTHTGTTPGAPLADLLFQYIFATVLHQLRKKLDDLDCRAFAGADLRVQLPDPTWMDDLSVPFLAERAVDVVPLASKALAEIAGAMQQIGVRVNWAQGKSELLAIFHGEGARSERARWSAAEGGTFCVTSPDGSAVRAHITPAYIHLGSLVDVRGGDLEDIRRRRVLARELQRPLMKLLCNPFLSPAEKLDLLLSMPVARFKHGSGLWRLQGPKEHEAFRAGYMELLRRAFRPIVGCSSRGLTDDDICDGLGVLSADELRITELARHAGWLVAERSSSIQELWLNEGAWLQEAKAAVASCAPRQWKGSCPWAALVQEPSAIKPGIKGFVKRCRRIRAERGADKAPKWRTIEQARKEGWIFCHFSTEADHIACHRCEICSRSFKTSAALAAHRSKTHARQALASRLAGGSRCEICCVEFWSTRRLTEHLRKSVRCLQVLEASDTDPTDHVPQRFHFAWPPAAAAHGPRPFWATLSPEETAKPTASAAPVAAWPILPDISKGIYSKGLSGFVQAVVEFGLDTGLGCDDVPIGLIGVPTCLKGLVDCCLFISESFGSARSASWTVRGSWAVSVVGNRAVFKPLSAQLGGELPTEWQACLPS